MGDEPWFRGGAPAASVVWAPAPLGHDLGGLLQEHNHTRMSGLAGGARILVGGEKTRGGARLTKVAVDGVFMG